MAKKPDPRVAGDSRPPRSLDFLRAILEDDLKTGRFEGRVRTRFPPEPNGYLHIGHAKAICLDFGLAEEYGGLCNMRFDDTNPTKEEREYMVSILEDVRWLGFDWDDRLYHASDYFEQLYEYALQLIRAGKAYVDSLSAIQIREYRGTLTEPGRNGPYRDRTVEENLDLFERMRMGEFPNGAHVLRARIDMASGNLNLRDPVMYRILHASHPRTGDRWCIYPTYDFAHGQSDSIERVTHSICTLEFEDHRPLYDWFLENLGIYRSQQIEFARLNITKTILSKRRLSRLVKEGYVSGWNDPRMPTLSGLRRRGYTPEAIRDFCTRVGVSKKDSVVESQMLEHSLRQHLNQTSPRVMGVLRPLRVVIENYPPDQVEELTAINNPECPEAGVRKVPFSRVLYLEREDFMEDPPRRFLPARAGTGGPPAIRLLHHLRGSRQGRSGTSRGVALHLRPGHAGRRRARRAPGQGHPALGLRRPRRKRPGSSLRQPVHQGQPQRRRRRIGLHLDSQSRLSKGP